MSNATPRAPRLSGLPTGLPTPQRTGLPTPRRSLGPLHVPQTSGGSSDSESSRALSEAMRQNPPSAFRSPSLSNDASPAGSTAGLTPGGARRPSSAASSNTSHRSNGSMAPPLPPAPRTPAHPSILRNSHASSSAYPVTPTARGAALRRSLATRPESRQEDRPTTASRPSGLSTSTVAPTSFQVGDRVRMESMGMEGTLRFVGEIDGKPGTWAGVELSGGFAGRGKNDGSVAGKSYFSCAPQCGLFLQFSKLSQPTVGPGSAPRPPSVASSRSSVRDSGRATPSLSGRATPSISGRATPSISGRATPSISGRSTPSHGGMPPPRQTPLATSTRQPRVAGKTSAEASAAAQATITAGSRASKYLGMTAKQLSARSTLDSSTTSTIGSLSKSTNVLAKSTNGLSKSTSATPRAPRLSGAVGIGLPTPTRAGPRMSISNVATPARSGRTSAAGIRRPASAVPDMPPPPSPSKSVKSSGYGRPPSRQSDAYSSRPASRASESRPPTPMSHAYTALEASGSALQDRISSLMASTSSSSPSAARASLLNGPSLLTEEDLKVTSPIQQNRIDQLLLRIDTLEKENVSLVLEKGKTPEPKASIPLPPNEGSPPPALDPAVAAAESRAVNAERQVQAHVTRLTILESELSAASSTSKNLQASILALEQAAAAAVEDRARSETEARQAARDAAAKVEEAEALVAGLKEAVAAQDKGDSDHSAEVQAKAKEIDILQAKVARLGGDLERTRAESKDEVEGLKRAGQDTIALYEERLNAAEALRIEMESLVRARDEELNQSANPDRSLGPMSPPRLVRQQSTAAEIDNENLTEQVAHLNKRIAHFEDQIEDLQVQAERDEENFKIKLDKARAAERELQDECTAIRAERDEAAQSEAAAKQRVEEIEVALASNNSTLEGARAEIESLRAEVANLEDLQGAAQGDERAREVEKHAERERVSFKEEIARLQGLLEDVQIAKREAVATVSSSTAELEALRVEVAELKSDLQSALDDNDDLLQQHEELKAKAADSDDLEALHAQHTEVISLKETVAALQKDLEAAHALTQNGSAKSLQELNTDNSDLHLRLQASEDENRLLLAEVEDLREAVKSLEELMEDKIMAEESKLDNTSVSDENSAAEIEKLRKSLADAQAKFESQALKYQSDFDHLQKKVGDIDRQNQQEVQELESLIESKIYREDELEREIETLKYELARSSAASRAESSSSRHANGDGPTPVLGSFAAKTASMQDTCELCDEPGHEIEYCPLFSGSLQTSSTAGSPLAHKASENSRSHGAQPAAEDDGPWCEDCEAYGHSTEDCEYAQEVF